MANRNLSLECKDFPPEVLLKAKTELHETSETKEECLKELKKLIRGEQNLLANMSDDFLLQFLRARKFDTKKSFHLLKRFYLHKKHYNSMYRNNSLEKVMEVMNMNMMGFLPKRTQDGCALWVARCGMWDPNMCDFESILRFGLLCHEKALQNPVTQVCGIISLVDFKEFSLTHLYQLSLGAIKCFVSATMDCFPIRHKAIHIVNTPNVFTILFSMIKPFLTAKIRSRIHFHGDSMSSLHKLLPPDLLPEEFDGTLGPFENGKFYASLLDSYEELLRNDEFGYV